MAFVTFGYKTDWRLSKIAGLTWNHIDLRQGVVRLEPGETKNNQARMVYLDDEPRGVFNRKWEPRKRNGVLIPYVFPNKDDETKLRV